MRITYLHQYFQTPSQGVVGVSGTRSYEFGRRFVAMGHKVNVVTSLTTMDGNTSKGWFTTQEAGIEVHWFPVLYSNRMGFLRRVWAFWRFAVVSARKAAALDADLIFATSTPLTIAIPAIYACRRKRIPMVFEVRDIWPEAPRQMGVLTNPVLLWLARRLERAAYRAAAHVIALSPGQRTLVIEAGTPQEKVSMIPNCCDLDLFSPDTDGTARRKALGLGERFVMVYFGCMGPANGLEFILDAAAEILRRKVDEVVFVLHGDGGQRPLLEARKEREGLHNVIFSDYVNEKNSVAELAAAADVCLTIYKNLPILYTCSPNKMFDALAAGKPILTNMPGWLQQLIVENECGIFVEPDNVHDFADKVISLKNDPQRVAMFARNARTLAERAFSRDLLARELEAILMNIQSARNDGRTSSDDSAREHACGRKGAG